MNIYLANVIKNENFGLYQIWCPHARVYYSHFFIVQFGKQNEKVLASLLPSNILINIT